MLNESDLRNFLKKQNMVKVLFRWDLLANRLNVSAKIKEYSLPEQKSNIYKSNQFSETDKLGVTCIPKSGTPNQFLKNWRLISLLNVIYKLASGSIAERMKTLFLTYWTF